MWMVLRNSTDRFRTFVVEPDCLGRIPLELETFYWKSLVSLLSIKMRFTQLMGSQLGWSNFAETTQ